MHRSVLTRIESQNSLDVDSSDSGVPTTPSASLLDQTLAELNKLTSEEIRDLLVSVLFVLKHVDNSKLTHVWGLIAADVWVYTHLFPYATGSFYTLYSHLLPLQHLLPTSPVSLHPPAAPFTPPAPFTSPVPPCTHLLPVITVFL